MWAAAIILTILALILWWVLWVPVTLNINTITGEYFVKVRGIMKVSPVLKDDEFKFEVTVLFRKFYIDPWRKERPKKPVKKRKVVKKGKARKKLKRADLVLIKDLIRTFKVLRFNLNFDTDDYTLNARLVPVFVAVNQIRHVNIATNYLGQNSFIFEIQNRLWRPLVVLLRYYLKRINHFKPISYGNAI